MTAKKKTAAKAAPKKKAAAKKAAAKPKTKTATAEKSAAKKAPAAAKKSAAKKSGSGPSISSMDVNHGHIFALRPRVQTSFRPNDFMAAKRALRDESYASISEAARAVADEALSVTLGDSKRIDTNPRR